MINECWNVPPPNVSFISEWSTVVRESHTHQHTRRLPSSHTQTHTHTHPHTDYNSMWHSQAETPCDRERCSEMFIQEHSLKVCLHVHSFNLLHSAPVKQLISAHLVAYDSPADTVSASGYWLDWQIVTITVSMWLVLMKSSSPLIEVNGLNHR